MSTPTTIELQANGALDHAAVIANLKSHTVAGLQDFNPETKQLSRWIEVSGTQQFVQAQLIDAHLRLTTYSQDPLINDAIALRVKHWSIWILTLPPSTRTWPKTRFLRHR